MGVDTCNKPSLLIYQKTIHSYVDCQGIIVIIQLFKLCIYVCVNVFVFVCVCVCVCVLC